MGGWKERERNEKKEKGGVIKRDMAGGDTVFFALHLFWAHWSRVHWGRGRELGLEPGDKTLELDQERVCALEPSLIVCFHSVFIGHVFFQHWMLKGIGHSCTTGRIPIR